MKIFQGTRIEFTSAYKSCINFVTLYSAIVHPLKSAACCSPPPLATHFLPPAARYQCPRLRDVFLRTSPWRNRRWIMHKRPKARVVDNSVKLRGLHLRRTSFSRAEPRLHRQVWDVYSADYAATREITSHERTDERDRRRDVIRAHHAKLPSPERCAAFPRIFPPDPIRSRLLTACFMASYRSTLICLTADWQKLNCERLTNGRQKSARDPPGIAVLRLNKRSILHRSIVFRRVFSRWTCAIWRARDLSPRVVIGSVSIDVLWVRWSTRRESQHSGNYKPSPRMFSFARWYFPDISSVSAESFLRLEFFSWVYFPFNSKRILLWSHTYIIYIYKDFSKIKIIFFGHISRNQRNLIEWWN